MQRREVRPQEFHPKNPWELSVSRGVAHDSGRARTILPTTDLLPPLSLRQSTNTWTITECPRSAWGPRQPGDPESCEGAQGPAKSKKVCVILVLSACHVVSPPQPEVDSVRLPFVYYRVSLRATKRKNCSSEEVYTLKIKSVSNLDT